MQDNSTQNQLPLTVRHSSRNRKRSKRRAIYCKIHNCYLQSESPKYRTDLLGVKDTQTKKKLSEVLLFLSEESVSEDVRVAWIELFWCPQCEKRRWYHVMRKDSCSYRVTALSDSLCMEQEKKLPDR